MKNIFLIYLLIINFVGFISMYRDKRKALKNKWRTPEYYLILIAILGGSVGSYIGMKCFRHKTKHAKFRFGVPLIIISQIIIAILNLKK